VENRIHDIEEVKCKEEKLDPFDDGSPNRRIIVLKLKVHIESDIYRPKTKPGHYEILGNEEEKQEVSKQLK
jgi:hypothetical protein